MWQGTISTNSAVQTELQSGEKLLWSGKQQSGIRLRRSDAFQIPFSVMWGGFAIFWEASVFSTGAPFLFKLWGIPFVLVGLYLIFGRFIFDAKSREKTTYAVTNQRIIIVSELWGRKIKSLNLHKLPELTLEEKSAGNGTITFGSVTPYNAWNNSSWPGNQQTQLPSFEMISNARQIYNLIQETQQKER